ncbi:hypothetical protein GCM10022232_50470 [Streptomyces plumbiresistens]|uniref:Uncharacterized protein n=1 Tax=Streptomyces plumbiresistens TaxID=511811 RepID=A0ABP7S0I2_9ACTN
MTRSIVRKSTTWFIGGMWCNGLIDPTELAIEMHPETEREHARYIPGVPAPSMLPLNTLAARGEAPTAAARLGRHPDPTESRCQLSSVCDN